MEADLVQIVKQLLEEPPNMASETAQPNSVSLEEKQSTTPDSEELHSQVPPASPELAQVQESPQIPIASEAFLPVNVSSDDSATPPVAAGLTLELSANDPQPQEPLPIPDVQLQPQSEVSGDSLGPSKSQAYASLEEPQQ